MQAGYDPTDMGSGVNYGAQDFTDLGPMQTIEDALQSNDLKVGDLLSGDGETSGAIYGGDT